MLRSVYERLDLSAQVCRNNLSFDLDHAITRDTLDRMSPTCLGGSESTVPTPIIAATCSFASFSDPDGNGWLFQELTARLPGRIDSTATTFASANDLASAFRRAEAAHGEHEKHLGQRDANWPEWYADYMAAEQSGKELPQ